MQQGKLGKGGPTAAAGALAIFKWWQINVGVPLPLSAAEVANFKKVTQGHEVKQAQVLEPWIVYNIYAMSKSGRGALADFARLCLAIIGGCVRFSHAQRASGASAAQ